MQPNSLATRRSESSSPVVAYACVTTQDIVAGGGVHEIDFGAAKNVLLYIGFPCIVRIDDEEVAAGHLVTKQGAGAEVYTNAPMGNWKIARPVRRIAFLPPLGFGGGAESEYYGRHGGIIVQASNPGDIEPQAINPDVLPCHTELLSLTIGVGVTDSFTSLIDSLFNVGNATPTAVWLKKVSFTRTDQASPFPFTTERLFSFGLRKSNVPVGDQEWIFWNWGPSLDLCTNQVLPNVMLCPKAILDAYGASAGDFQGVYRCETRATASSLLFALTFAYLL